MPEGEIKKKSRLTPRLTEKKVGQLDGPRRAGKKKVGHHDSESKKKGRVKIGKPDRCDYYLVVVVVVVVKVVVSDTADWGK